MLATDLGDAEIVLGKLAARLVPILALVAATVPVLRSPACSAGSSSRPSSR